MDTTRRVVRNALVLLASDLVRIALGLVVTAAVARRLGGAPLGDLAYMLALVSMLTVIADAGLSQFYARAAQTDRGGALLGVVLTVRIIASTAAAGGLALYAAMAAPSLRPVLYLGGLLVWMTAVPSWVGAFFRAREQMAPEGIAKVLGSMLTAVGVLAVTGGGFGVPGVAGVMVGVSVLVGTALLGVGLARMPRPIVLRQPLPEYGRILREAWPFAALAILGTIYFRIDGVMLYALRGRDALGQYSAAYRVMETALLVPWVLSASALPPVVRHLQTRTAEVIRASRQALHLLFAISVPLAVLGAVLAPELFRLLYGPAFAEAAGIFRILAFTLIAVFASAVTSTLIAAGPRPMVNAWLALLMVIENVGLNLVVIPRWGGAGAAAATLITETTGLVLGTLYVRWTLAPLAYLGFAVRPALGALAAAGTALLYPSVAVIPFAALVYVGVMWLSGGLTTSDLSFIRAVFTRAHPTLRTGDA